jgi:hypothetical protein
MTKHENLQVEFLMERADSGVPDLPGAANANMLFYENWHSETTQQAGYSMGATGE